LTTQVDQNSVVYDLKTGLKERPPSINLLEERKREKLASPAPFYVSAGRRPWSSWFKTDNMTASFEIWVLCE
jgi:hypothetical protein